ncbi:DUF3866 family protein [Trueperella sp. LYQ141]|uniref:DUF3866 family protein n=1 Tax=Trueperella sp. LYQ141 TaxID=3391058 RepID=UPI0039836FEA
MMWKSAQVIRVAQEWGQCRVYDLVCDDGTQVRAIGYVPLVGRADIGEEVLITSATLAKNLGTGGFAMIAAIPHALPTDNHRIGHIVKARYTPLQYTVLSVDEPDSPHYPILCDADSIDAMPVICADLHSALPAIIAGIRCAAPQARIAYIMTDGGALPAWFSHTAWQLRENGHIIGTISCGQAFGGELEAVSIHTALLAARLVWHADIAIVAQGPGNLGTDTRWGFSGVAIGEALNAVYALHGHPIACVRASSADSRQRHWGISHHTMRVLKDVVRVPTTVVNVDLPHMDPALHARITEQFVDLASIAHLRFVSMPGEDLTAALINPPAPLRTMGRGFAEDPLSFYMAGASGYYAGQLLHNAELPS